MSCFSLFKNLLEYLLLIGCTFLIVSGCFLSESSDDPFELSHPHKEDIHDSASTIKVIIIYGENDSQQLYSGPVKKTWPGEINKQNIVLEVVQFSLAGTEIARDQYCFSYKSGDYILEDNPLKNTLGWSCFAANGKIHKCAVGGIAQAVYSSGGNHACFSADGKLIFFNIGPDVWVVKNNGQDARKIGTHTTGSGPCIAAYRPEPQTVMMVKGEDLYKIDADTQVETLVFDGNQKFYGDIAISSDGTRIAARLSNGDLYKAELNGTNGNWNFYGSYCSASISPNGTWLTENLAGHSQMKIYNWNGKSTVMTNTLGWTWDNQRFSVNSDDWVSLVFDNAGKNTGYDFGVHQVSTNKTTYVGHVPSGTTMYPDFWYGPLPDPD